MLCFLIKLKPDGIVRGVMDIVMNQIIASRWTIRNCFLIKLNPDGIVRGMMDILMNQIIASRWTTRNCIHVY